MYPVLMIKMLDNVFPVQINVKLNLINEKGNKTFIGTIINTNLKLLLCVIILFSVYRCTSEIGHENS